MNQSHNMLVSTVCGTLLSIAPQLFNWSALFMDILKTTVLAAMGATVSFTVSLLLRYIVRKIRE